MTFNQGQSFQKRRVVAWAIYLMFFGILAYDCAAQRPPATVFGEYRGAGCPAGNKTDCLSTKRTDRVRILRGRGGQSSIRINLVFEQGHTCSLEGQAVWSNNRFVINAEGIDPQKPCRLTVRIKGSILTLEDARGNCREVYCGVRGAFQGARFRKVQ
jgi:hypothetical protein